MGQTTCGECGHALPDDGAVAAELRAPCPRCGSRKRNYTMVGSGGIGLGGSATITLDPAVLQAEGTGTGTGTGPSFGLLGQAVVTRGENAYHPGPSRGCLPRLRTAPAEGDRGLAETILETGEPDAEKRTGGCFG
jgi:predicted  nucleic acid-binding Zn-ribbon protein